MPKDHHGSSLEYRLKRLRDNAWAITNSSHIRLDKDRLALFIDNLPVNEYQEHPMITSTKLDISQKIALTMFWGVVNYCYSDPGTKIEYQYSQRAKSYRRSDAFFQALVRSKIDWRNCVYVANLTHSQWCEILQLSAENILYDVDGRLNKIHQLAMYLENKNLSDFFRHYNSDEKLFRLLIRSNQYNDVFLKRAQIVISLIGRLAKRYNLSYKHDVRLTAMADYRIPQILYNSGILKLDDPTLQKIMSYQIFHKDEPDELAIRAWTIVVCKKIADEIGETEEFIDNILWNLSQKMLHLNKLPIPAILSETDCY